MLLRHGGKAIGASPLVDAKEEHLHESFFEGKTLFINDPSVKVPAGSTDVKETQKEPDTRKDSNMLSGRVAMFDSSTMEQCLVTTLGWSACGCKEDP